MSARGTAGGGFADVAGAAGRVTTVSVSTIADPHTAFGVFTAGMGVWWQRGNPLTGRYLREVCVDPFVGGSLRGKDADGEQICWGVVLAWEPGEQFVFDCLADPGPNVSTSRARTGTVSVRFTGTGAGITLVEVVHQRLAGTRSGLLRRTATGENGGWADGLAAYTAAADRAVQFGAGAPSPP
jgi:hypothetical protein